MKEVLADPTLDFSIAFHKRKAISFDESLHQHFDLPAYPELLIKRPRRIASTSNGFMIVPSTSDYFTHMGADVVDARRARHHFSDRTRVHKH